MCVHRRGKRCVWSGMAASAGGEVTLTWRLIGALWIGDLLSFFSPPPPPPHSPPPPPLPLSTLRQSPPRAVMDKDSVTRQSKKCAKEHGSHNEQNLSKVDIFLNCISFTFSKCAMRKAYVRENAQCAKHAEKAQGLETLDEDTHTHTPKEVQ